MVSQLAALLWHLCPGDRLATAAGHPHPAGAGAMTCEKSPIEWSVYVTVDDVDAAVRACTEAGGEVLMLAFDCPEVGSIAYLKDPEGASFVVITYLKPM
ncbi:VOC family protein [Rubritalea sp.]|uniref:VOC family protein n=1 Tax=Rubritalea sp. TaxID=2109375 RepID=UPI003EFB0D73